MPIDDEQLDDLLRDARVPTGLKSRLLEIPDEQAELLREVRGSKSRLAIVGALAAIAATVLVILNLPSADVANVQDVDKETAEQLLARMEQDLKAMEKICDAQDLELARLDASVKVPAVDLKEALSLAMSVSWQSAVDQGAKIESVKSELEYVINTYPNTAGAQQAQDILQAN